MSGVELLSKNREQDLVNLFKIESSGPQKERGIRILPFPNPEVVIFNQLTPKP